MATNTGHVMTLANSIIGVSVLAMPFCFKQCGISLAIVMLILSSITSRLACHFLVKSSSMCKRRNFEFLAFHTFGPSGKLLVELGIIGFMMGTCVAFFVVIGDLGPEIISKMFHIKNDATLRSMVLLGLGCFVVLPLGLLRNIESLAAISTVTIGFYFLLIVKMFLESFSHLLARDWIQHVNFWQPEGVLQCIPIFSMALSCQTQIFEIYESLPVPTLDKMNSVVRSAVNMCTGVYISVGLLGYIAYCTRNFTGNILLSFAPSLASEMYKLGFVMSIAVSFPLVIFPCRASLYSLIFRRMPVHHELSQTSSHIPDLRFKCLTVAIVCVAMVTGLLIPSIELVLGFVGSTIGVAICVIFPALLFINLTNKETNERITAKVTLFVGLVIMLTGSLANYQAATEVASAESAFDVKFKLPRNALASTESAPVVDKQLPDAKPLDTKKSVMEKAEAMEAKAEKASAEQKKEPPVPIAPAAEPSKEPVAAAPVQRGERKDVAAEAGKADNAAKEEAINGDAIEKEEREMRELEERKKSEDDRKQQQLFQKLKEYQDEEKKLLQEQEKILHEIKSREKERTAKKEPPKETPDDVKQEVKQIKPEEFHESIQKIQNVIDDLEDTRNAIAEEKRSEMEKKKKKKEPEKEEEAAAAAAAAAAKPPRAKDEEKPKVASVPLPLAKLQGGEKAPVLSKQEAMGRDILEDSKQGKLVRERRDAEDKPEECPVATPDAVNNTDDNSNLIKSSRHVSVDIVDVGDGLKLEQANPLSPDAKLAFPKKRDLKSVRQGDKNSKTYR